MKQTNTHNIHQAPHHGDREIDAESRSTRVPPTSDNVDECACRMSESRTIVSGDTLVNWLAAEVQLRRELQQAYWISEELTRRSRRFSPTTRADNGPARTRKQGETTQ